MPGKVRTRAKKSLYSINTVYNRRMDPAVFDLHELIRSQMQSLLPAAREKRLVLDLILEKDSPRWVRGNSVACSSGVFSLVRETIRRTDSGGVEVRLVPALGSADSDSSDSDALCARVVVRGSGNSGEYPILGAVVSVTEIESGAK